MSDIQQISPTANSPQLTEAESGPPSLEALLHRDAEALSTARTRLTESSDNFALMPPKPLNNHSVHRGATPHGRMSPQREQRVQEILAKMTQPDKAENSSEIKETKEISLDKWVDKTKVGQTDKKNSTRLERFAQKIKNFFNIRQKYKNYRNKKAKIAVEKKARRLIKNHFQAKQIDKWLRASPTTINAKEILKLTINQNNNFVLNNASKDERRDAAAIAREILGIIADHESRQEIKLPKEAVNTIIKKFGTLMMDFNFLAPQGYSEAKK